MQQITPTYPSRIYCYPSVVHKPVCLPTGIPSTTNTHSFMYPHVSHPNMSFHTNQINTPSFEKGLWTNTREVRYLGCGVLSSNPLTQTFRHIPRLIIHRIMASATRVETPSPAFPLPAYLTSFLRTPSTSSWPCRPCAHRLLRVFQMQIFRTRLIQSHALIWHPSSHQYRTHHLLL